MTSDQHLPSGDRDGRGADLRHLQLRVDGLDHAHRGRRRHHGGPGELGRWRHGPLSVYLYYLCYAPSRAGSRPSWASTRATGRRRTSTGRTPRPRRSGTCPAQAALTASRADTSSGLTRRFCPGSASGISVSGYYTYQPLIVCNLSVFTESQRKRLNQLLRMERLIRIIRPLHTRRGQPAAGVRPREREHAGRHHGQPHRALLRARHQGHLQVPRLYAVLLLLHRAVIVCALHPHHSHPQETVQFTANKDKLTTI